MIQTTAEILRVIEQDREELTSRMLRDLIKEHRDSGDAKRLRDLWKRYTLEDAPIKRRKPANYEKVNRSVAHDFYADIVDTKTGYMGNEVSISLAKQDYTIDGVLDEADYDADASALRTFALENASEDQNSEMVRDAGAVGVGYRLLYVMPETARVRIKDLNAHEVIYIYDQSIDEPQLALRYYTIQDRDNQHTEYTSVEWYDDTEVRYYIDDGKLNFTLDLARAEGGRQFHLFDGIPVIPFPNNRELKAEPEKVLDLIDAYDAIVSSSASEIEQLRMAYMYVKDAGLNIDDEFVRQLEQTGIFGLGQDGEVGFVNKQLADQAVINILAEIRRNIYQFAKSIDMSQDFGGEMRVIGWQVALLNLENSAKITERKFTRALRHQYTLIADYWRRIGYADVDPLRLEFEFTRNFPRDIQGEAETLQLLLNTVSTRTAFSQMSFIDDVDEEIRRIEEERAPYREALNGDEGFGDERAPDESPLGNGD